MMSLLVKNGTLVNEGKSFRGALLVNGDRIEAVLTDPLEIDRAGKSAKQVMDAGNCYIFPGFIDDQVHFREPGLTHKAEILTESKAAVAGGITSFMEMPNTVPNTLTQELLEQKYSRAAEVSVANYSFFMGVSHDNINEVLRTDPATVCGIKIFMGSSTGNMLVDDHKVLEQLFAESPLLIATHCEDEATIRRNLEAARTKYGEDIPVSMHPLIRDTEACYRSSALAVELAAKYGSRLHVLHISSGKELSLFQTGTPENKKITAEACVHHLWFSADDYSRLGNLIKWNPAVKSSENREALWKGLKEGRIDVLATDHAPHTVEEKSKPYLQAPSGGPLVQHALPLLMECVGKGRLTIEDMVQRYAHHPAICFRIRDRGFLRPGCFADFTLVNPDSPWMVKKENILYKCGWSPLEGVTFRSKVMHTFVNGKHVYENGRGEETGVVHSIHSGQRLKFDR
ncbi:MAG: dihydroorotase [Bacteroidia bacterium]|nr:dihydroorotase [Bacteroidia bacterium]